MQDGHRFNIAYGNDCYYELRKKRKKNKRVRIIHAPSPNLKKIQREFADWFYKIKKDEFDKNPQITGFMPGKSIADNAKPHLDKDWVVTLDIKDFFPSTAWSKVEEEFESLPRTWNLRYLFSKNKPTAFKSISANDLAKITCLKNGLPQGSPASPVIANYIAIKEVDEKVQKVLQLRPNVKDVSYTRYADDITVSFNGGDREDAVRISQDVANRVNRNLYEIKEQKTDIKHRSQRQLVTGIIVNGENPRIDRRTMNNMRAAIHNLNKNDEEASDEIKGMMSFIQSINKAQYEKLNNQIGD